MMIRTEYTAVDVDGVRKNSHKASCTKNRDRLLDNLAIALSTNTNNGGSLLELENRVTVVKIFASEPAAKSAVRELERQGLRSDQIFIIATDCQEYENLINWEDIAINGGLIVVLALLGISVHDTLQLVDAVEEGKFLVMAIVSDRSASQAQYILESIGHKVIAVY